MFPIHLWTFSPQRFSTISRCDGGTNFANWANQLTLGTNYTGSFVAVTQGLTGLGSGSNYVFRFYAANTNGNSWGAAKYFMTYPAPAIIAWTRIGSQLVLNWPADQGWQLEIQTK